jgi:hypothetical protein
MPLCRWGADFCSQHKWSWFCGLTLQYCQLTVFGRILMAQPGINVYDIRKKCEGPLCYDFSDADKYLNRWVERRTGPCRRCGVCVCAAQLGLAAARETSGWPTVTAVTHLPTHSAAVKKALGVDEEAEWQECNMLINAAFYGERPGRTTAEAGQRVWVHALAALNC